MAELLSRLDLFNIARRYVHAHAKRIDPSQVDVDGSDINLVAGLIAHMAAAVVTMHADRLAAHMLGSAERDDLDRWLLDHYELPRKGASAAVGTCRFYRASTAAGAGIVPTGKVLQALTGVEYVTTNDAVFSATSLQAYADVRATKAGKESQVGRNQIRRIVSPGDLFDKTIAVNNDEPTAGGEPREADDAYRMRGRSYWRAAQRATKSAIEFGALQVAGVASAQAIEALTQGAMPARVVSLYLSDSSGVANAALGRAAQAHLDEWRAAGIAVVTAPSTPQIVSVVLSLTFQASVDTLRLTDEVRAAVAEYINSLDVNATLTRAALFSVLHRFKSRGLIVDESSIIVPAGSVVPTAGKTLRTTLDKVMVQ